MVVRIWREGGEWGGGGWLFYRGKEVEKEKGNSGG